MAPNQFVRTDKRAKNTDHTECKLNRWLSEFQREAEDASTDCKFLDLSVLSWNLSSWLTAILHAIIDVLQQVYQPLLLFAKLTILRTCHSIDLGVPPRPPPQSFRRSCVRYSYIWKRYMKQATFGMLLILLERTLDIDGKLCACYIECNVMFNP